MASFTPPAITTDTLRFRVDTGNMAKSGGQRGSLTRVVQKLGALQAATLEQQHQDDQTASSTGNIGETTASTTAQKEFSREVSLLELEMTKLIMYEQKLKRQIAENEVNEQQMAAEIEAMKNRAETTRREAQVAQQTRACLQEYEALAKLINMNHPQSQSDLRQKIETTDAAIESVQNEIDTLSSKIKVREAQYTLLMQYMFDLKADIANESAIEAERQEKEKSTAAAASAAAAAADEGKTSKKDQIEQQQQKTDTDAGGVTSMDIDG